MSQKNTAIVQAFIEAMRRCCAASRDGGKWIPISYWVVKVCHQLDSNGDEQDIYLLQGNNNKLLTILQKHHIVGRQFEREECYGSITRVSWNKRKAIVDGESKKKDIVFLCLETKKKQQPMPNQGQSTQDMYQQAYDSWNRRDTHVSRHEIIEWRRQPTDNRHTLLTIDTYHNHDGEDSMSSSSGNHQQTATVTPTDTSEETEWTATATEEYSDIKELLSSFVNPKYLENKDFLIADSVDIRDAI
jgi:hypothetical protein